VKKIAYEEYMDKILGCWIGKCIGGTIGAQVEGTKELMNFTLETAFPEEIPPNDDLDLQVLWLETMLEKGVHITSCDLADAWMARCWYPFNEYGTFKRNYAKGIRPPFSGSFDNAYWETGMGCPIRAEIWGLICPANPELASIYAYTDGCLDHTGQSIGAEQLWSAVVSEAFFDDDILGLVRKYYDYLPEGTAVRGCVDSVFDSHEKGLDWKDARMRMLIQHGHPEACDAPVNTGITVMAILYGEGDFGLTQLIALNSGYDTDCTAATAGAVMGGAIGAKNIPAEWKDPIGTEFVTGIDLARTDLSIDKLARDTAAVGVAMAGALNSNIEITNVPREIIEIAPSTEREPKIAMSLDYMGMPSIAWGETKRTSLRISNETETAVSGRIEASGPEGWVIDVGVRTVEIEPGHSASVDVIVTVPKSLDIIAQANPLNVRLVDADGEALAEESFGISGAAPWHCMGVFFDTFDSTKSETCPWFVDGKYVVPSDGFAWQNHFVNPDKEYIKEGDFEYTPSIEKMKTFLGDDAILMAQERDIPVDATIGLKMQMCAYLVLNLVSPEDRKATLHIGVTDILKVWVNGELVGANEECRPWSPRSTVIKCSLNKGVNRIVFKAVRRTDNLRISLAVRCFEGSKDVNHVEWFTDFAYALDPLFVED